MNINVKQEKKGGRLMINWIGGIKETSRRGIPTGIKWNKILERFGDLNAYEKRKKLNIWGRKRT